MPFPPSKIRQPGASRLPKPHAHPPGGPASPRTAQASQAQPGSPRPAHTPASLLPRPSPRTGPAGASGWSMPMGARTGLPLRDGLADTRKMQTGTKYQLRDPGVTPPNTKSNTKSRGKCDSRISTPRAASEKQDQPSRLPRPVHAEAGARAEAEARVEAEAGAEAEGEGVRAPSAQAKLHEGFGPQVSRGGTSLSTPMAGTCADSGAWSVPTTSSYTDSVHCQSGFAEMEMEMEMAPELAEHAYCASPSETSATPRPSGTRTCQRGDSMGSRQEDRPATSSSIDGAAPSRRNSYALSSTWSIYSSASALARQRAHEDSGSRTLPLQADEDDIDRYYPVDHGEFGDQVGVPDSRKRGADGPEPHPVTLEWEPDPEGADPDEVEELWRRLERKMGRTGQSASRTASRVDRGRWVMVALPATPVSHGPDTQARETTSGGTREAKPLAQAAQVAQRGQMVREASEFSVSAYMEFPPTHPDAVGDVPRGALGELYNDTDLETKAAARGDAEADAKTNAHGGGEEAMFDMTNPLVPSAHAIACTPFNTPCIHRETIHRAGRVSRRKGTWKSSGAGTGTGTGTGPAGIATTTAAPKGPSAGSSSSIFHCSTSPRPHGPSITNLATESTSHSDPSSWSSSSSTSSSTTSSSAPSSPLSSTASPPGTVKAPLPREMCRLDSHVVAALVAFQATLCTPELDRALSLDRASALEVDINRVPAGEPLLHQSESIQPTATKKQRTWARPARVGVYDAVGDLASRQRPCRQDDTQLLEVGLGLDLQLQSKTIYSLCGRPPAPGQRDQPSSPSPSPRKGKLGQLRSSGREVEMLRITDLDTGLSRHVDVACLGADMDMRCGGL